MQKTYLFSVQIGQPLANALNYTGYMDTVLFLTIVKPDIYLHKSLGKSATDFYPGDQQILKLATDLPKLIHNRYPTYHNTVKLHLLPYQQAEKVLYLYIL
jgi:hypothetical protein